MSGILALGSPSGSQYTPLTKSSLKRKFQVRGLYTKDLDIWIEASAENAAKTFAALKKFNAPLFDLKAEDFAEEGFFYMMGRPPSRIDILMSLAGVTFHEAWEKKKIISIDPQLQTYFISKDDLIKNKRSAGRDVDIIDVKRLETSN